MTLAARNDWIDLLRTTGASAVALFHFNAVPLPPPAVAGPWRETWHHGHWGVGMFFSLSGYCLFNSWTSSPGLQVFLHRRLARILPPYWCSLLLVLVLAAGVKWFTGVNDIARLPASPSAILATLSLTTSPATSIPTMNWVYWTLTVLLGCNLVMATTLLAPASQRLRMLAGLHAVLCATDAAFSPRIDGPAFLVGYWPVFGAGLALAAFGRHRPIGIFMLLTSVLHAAWSSIRGTPPVEYVLAGVLTTAALAVASTRSYPRWLVPLARVGPYSYSLYLIHVPIGVYLVPRLLPAQYTSAIGLILGQSLQLGICLLATRLFYLAAERPFQARSLSG